MPMYNLIEYNDNYSKKSGGLQQYYRAIIYTGTIANFHAAENSASFKFKQKTTDDDRTKMLK